MRWALCRLQILSSKRQLLREETGAPLPPQRSGTSASSGLCPWARLHYLLRHRLAQPTPGRKQRGDRQRTGSLPGTAEPWFFSGLPSQASLWPGSSEMIPVPSSVAHCPARTFTEGSLHGTWVWSFLLPAGLPFWTQSCTPPCPGIPAIQAPESSTFSLPTSQIGIIVGVFAPHLEVLK